MSLPVTNQTCQRHLVFRFKPNPMNWLQKFYDFRTPLLPLLLRPCHLAAVRIPTGESQDVARPSNLQLTIGKAVPPVGGLVLRCAVISSFPGTTKRQVQFHEELGLQEESSHTAPGSETWSRRRGMAVMSKMNILLQKVNSVTSRVKARFSHMQSYAFWSPVLSSGVWQFQTKTRQSPRASGKANA